METKTDSQTGKTRCEAEKARCRIAVVSLFPSYFEGPLGTSILGRAQDRGMLEFTSVDLRAFGEGHYRRVDDRPYGGGPGMVLMPGPLTKAIRSVRSPRSHVVCLSPQGKLLDAAMARRLAQHPELVVVCGHYEGIDERVLDREVDEHVRVGDFVVTNGCVPALLLIDAIARFVPGVLSEGAAEAESFQGGILEGPHYTRPESFEERSIPPVLRTGNHHEINRWRHQEGVHRTAARRPDLLAEYLTEGRIESNQETGVTLWVKELRASLRFYCDVLGWSARQMGENKAVVKAPGLGLVLLEGVMGEGARAHVWVRGDVRERVEQSGWCHRVRKGNRIEICDPDGHVWSIGEKEE